ncbi:MAG: alkaline phosphatase [Acidobacteriia bacterium]|nr:alkaline phosphatase [Terriglobia bacterium]
MLVIGIDGLGGAQLARRHTDAIARLMREGASTLHARAVLPTESGPNWTAMLSGAPPESPGGPAPTIFDETRAQMPSAVIGVFYEWAGFAQLVDRRPADVFEHGSSAEDTVNRAAAFLRDRKPTLTFVHLDLVDHAGHRSGWRSARYRKAVQTADTLVGRLLAAVNESGEEDDTMVLLSADHGGRKKDHGGATPREIEIPWIVKGPGIAPGVTLKSDVSTCDTAATVASALGLSLPARWTGRPVSEALAGGQTHSIP